MKAIRLTITGFAVLVLTACGQPATESAEEAPATAPAAEQAAGGSDNERLASIDEDGNIAPFGFASKQPVEIADPAPQATADAGSQASSELYGLHCAACHGADARGVAGLGLNLVESELVGTASNDELTAFLKTGRPADSPDSVTKIPMPAFAWMSAEQLGEITAYLKSL